MSFVFNSNFRCDNIIDIKAYLEINYYFVDNREREQIAYNSHEYLIEQTVRLERFSLSQVNALELLLQNPVKEIIWVIKRSDIDRTNDWFNFMDSGSHIMKSSYFLFNGMERFTEKDPEYFNYVQPFQHHKSCPKDGIYVYSFSLMPDDLSQPSGSCNMSRINKVQMMLNIIKPYANTYEYNLTMYVINYNFLQINI